MDQPMGFPDFKDGRNAIMDATKCEARLSQDKLTKNLTGDKKNKVHPISEHVIRKRLPPRLPRSDKDIYVTNKTNFKVTRCFLTLHPLL